MTIQYDCVFLQLHVHVLEYSPVYLIVLLCGNFHFYSWDAKPASQLRPSTSAWERREIWSQASFASTSFELKRERESEAGCTSQPTALRTRIINEWIDFLHPSIYTYPAGTVRFASLGAKRTRWNFFAWLQASCKRIQAPLAWSVLTDHSRLAKSKVFEAKVTLASLQAKPPHQKKLPLISLRFQTSENTQKTFSTPRCFKPSEMNIPQGSLSLLVKWENPRKKFLLAWIPAKRNEHSSRFTFASHKVRESEKKIPSRLNSSSAKWTFLKVHFRFS